MLAWFDENPDRHWWIVCLVTATVVFILLRPILRGELEIRKRSDWWWTLAIVALLTVGRWPTWFVSRQFNEDESFLIAGAMTLRHDPLFFRAVDGSTAGPIDFYALLPAGFFQGQDNFFSARVTALVLLALALSFVHQTLALIAARTIARIATLSTALFEGLTLHIDLLHYSTELVSIALLSLAGWAGTIRLLGNGSRRWSFIGGLSLGLVPLAKVQAAPTALCLGLIWTAGEIWSAIKTQTFASNLITLCIGAFAPLITASCILLATGEWQNAIIPYVFSNISYTNSSDIGQHLNIISLWATVSSSGTLFGSWLLGCGAWLTFTLPFSRAADRTGATVAFTSVCILLVSLGTVLAPARPFLHYCQLLVVPVTMVFGTNASLVLESFETRRRNLRSCLVCAALICSCAPILVERAGSFHPHVGSLATQHAQNKGEVALELSKYARPGDSLAVWGWMNSCYVEMSLPQATRSAATVHEVLPGKYQEYYKNRYLADFERSRPPLFIDTTSPKNLHFADMRKAHDFFFPSLAKVIRSDYANVSTVDYVRIYVRKDRLAELATPTPSR